MTTTVPRTLQELLASVPANDPRRQTIDSPQFQTMLAELSKMPEFGGSGVLEKNLNAMVPGLVPEGYYVNPRTGEVKKEMSTGKKLLLAGATFGGPLLAGLVGGTGAALQQGVQQAGQQAGTAAASGGVLGGISKYAPLLSKGADFLSGMSQQQTANRVYGDQAQSEYDNALLARSREEDQRAMIDLQRKQFGSNEYQRNFQNSVRGGALAGMQDLNIEAPAGIPMGKVTGGMRPSAILNREQIGNTVQQQAMKNLVNPQGFDPMSPIPQPHPPSAAGAGEKWTGRIGGLLNLLPSPTDPKPTGTTGSILGPNYADWLRRQR